MDNLIDLKVGELLKKFGAGDHKPGSGSASAFNGMLSAQMLLTVIDLTADPKRRTQYKEVLDRFGEIQLEIDTRVYPKLAELFQRDSEEFDKVIRLRDERDAERDLMKKRALSGQAHMLLKIATEIPAEIADLCLELADFSIEIFDNGFRSARGDAGVALNNALAGVISCLSIIELNLLSVPADEWTDLMLKRRKKIRGRYDAYSASGDEKLKILESESARNLAFQQANNRFALGNLAREVRTDADLERIARELQNHIWGYKDKVWKKEVPEVELQILQPGPVLTKILGYIYEAVDSLGIHEVDGERFETAGIIDKKEKIVRVSNNFPSTTQRFTLAHELAHAILHDKVLLHRDKPLDGSAGAQRSVEERQADKFAALFLMPEKVVQKVFNLMFGMPVFELNEATALAIRAGNVGDFRRKCQNVRGLARVIASVDFYAGRNFNSLESVFQVSNATMAIRLEELGLVVF